MAAIGLAAAARICVVLVDDNTETRRAVQLRLRAGLFEVRAYASGTTMLADPAAVEPDCLVVRDRMADGDGFELLRGVRSRGWLGPAVLLTDAPSLELTAAAARAGFVAVVDRPLVDDVILRAVAAAARFLPEAAA